MNPAFLISQLQVAVQLLKYPPIDCFKDELSLGFWNQLQKNLHLKDGPLICIFTKKVREYIILDIVVLKVYFLDESQNVLLNSQVLAFFVHPFELRIVLGLKAILLAEFFIFAVKPDKRIDASKAFLFIAPG